MTCPCGSVPTSVIEMAMLDPRNGSSAFWRERYADTIVESHADSPRPDSQPEPEAELPDGWTLQRDEMSGRDIYWNDETGELLFEPPPPPEEARKTAKLRGARAEDRAIAAEL